MKVADQRHIAAERIQFFPDQRHRARGFLGVDGQPNQFGTGLPQRMHLGHRAGDIGGIGIGHRLHHDRRTAAHGNVADENPARRASNDG